MASQPLVSIVIDNYNYARFLPDAIGSAIAQTYPRVEVIVVDDGSTDNSREVISSYGERVIPVLKKNGGHASAFNAGFRASHGEIVMFLDADDALLPEAAARVVEAWTPRTAKVQWVLRHVDGDRRPLGGVVPYAPASMPSGDIRDFVAATGNYSTPPTSGNAFSRAVLERLMPIDESLWRQAAETPLLVLAPFSGEVNSIPEVLGLYRVHGGNHGALRTLDPRKLRVKLIIDMQREWTLAEFGRREGIPMPTNRLQRDLGHAKYRIASLRIDPEHHPFLDDRRFSLAMRGLRACLSDPRYNLKGRLLHTAWFSLMALAPDSAVERVASAGLLR